MTVARLHIGDDLVHFTSDVADVARVAEEILVDLACGPAVAAPRRAVHAAIEAADDGRLHLRIDGEIVHTGIDASHALDQFMSWANHQAVVSRPSHISIHAAGLVDDAGDRALIAPAAPASGKTTLAGGLCAAGWRYLSDEVVAIDPATLEAAPYPKPLTIKPGGRHLAHVPASRTISPRQQRWYVRPSELGSDVGGPARPTMLVFPRYLDGSPLRVVAAGATESALELAVNCQDQLDADGRRLHALARLAASTVRARVLYGSGDDAVAAVARLAAEPPPEAPLPQLLDLDATSARTGPSRAPGTVAVALDDGVLVHHCETQRLVSLDPIGGVVWRLLDGRASLPALADELAGAYDTDATRVAADLTPLLDRLRLTGLVHYPGG